MAKYYRKKVLTLMCERLTYTYSTYELFTF